MRTDVLGGAAPHSDHDRSEAVRVAVGAIRRTDGGPSPASLEPVTRTLGETRALRDLRISPSGTTEHARRPAVPHALDHLDRLTGVLAEAGTRARDQDDDGNIHHLAAPGDE